MFDIEYSPDELINDVSIYDPRDNSGTDCKLPLNYAVDELDQFCLYVSNLDSDAITHSALINAKTMFEIMDKRPYNNDDNLKARIEYITLVLEARVNESLSTKSLIKSYVLRNCDKRLLDIIQNDIIKNVFTQKITDSTCKYLNTMIYENLIEGYSLRYSKELKALFTKKERGEYKRMSEYTNDLKNLIRSFDEDAKRSEEYMREGTGFDLSSDNIEHEVHAILKDLKAPTNRLRSGIQYLNRMLNGGFESGRSYLFMGITGVGKSIVLLSCALWIAKYNKLPKNKDFRYAVLFISQENSKNESFERLFNICVSGADVSKMSEEDVVDGLRKSGMLIDSTNDNINFIFKQFRDQEIGVDDIDALISDYERKGIQIIAVIQDYIEKLRAKNHLKDELRIRLGSVATEMSELAKRRKMPFISAAQLNRLGSSVVDNAVSNNKKNTIKLLGKQNVSESWDMMKNVDYSIIINREIDDTVEPPREYMGFKLEKHRAKKADNAVVVFIHPFDETNGILLIPDVDRKPLSKLSIEDFNPFNSSGNKIKSKGDPNYSQVYDKSSIDSEFSTSFAEIISEDFKDSDENYEDVCKYADEIATSNIERLQQREADIRLMRKNELRKLDYSKLTINTEGKIVIPRNEEDIPDNIEDEKMR